MLQLSSKAYHFYLGGWTLHSPALSLSQVQADVHEALQQWHRGDDVASPLRHYLLLQKAQLGGGPLRQASNTILLQALETLAIHYPQAADLLRSRFLDQDLAHTIANKLNVGESKIYGDQRRAIGRLAEVVLQLEDQARQMRWQTLTKRLDSPTHTPLVGIDPHVATLLAPIMTPGPPWLIALNGLGGIGKTTLADALMRRAIADNLWEEIGWVSARQNFFNLGGQIKAVVKPVLTANALLDALAIQLFADTRPPNPLSSEEILTQLEKRLKQHPHLIVIDNLETLVDVEELLPILRRLAQPTKFLLTSRESLLAEADIFHFPVPDLGEVDALHLVRQEARLRNLPTLASSSDQDLRSIYTAVGGNPLALRLVVGQVHMHALPVVLEDLATARGEPVEHLYTFVYQRAWEHLDEVSRDVLLAMPLMPPYGGDLDLLAGVSHLDAVDLRRGLDQLIERNLVDSRGDLNQRRYTIHPLTRTFLQQQVVKWQATPRL